MSEKLPEVIWIDPDMHVRNNYHYSNSESQTYYNTPYILKSKYDKEVEELKAEIEMRNNYYEDKVERLDRCYGNEFKENANLIEQIQVLNDRIRELEGAREYEAGSIKSISMSMDQLREFDAENTKKWLPLLLNQSQTLSKICFLRAYRGQSKSLRVVFRSWFIFKGLMLFPVRN